MFNRHNSVTLDRNVRRKKKNQKKMIPYAIAMEYNTVAIATYHNIIHYDLKEANMDT